MSTGIHWTERTWNPSVGCHHKSPGCDHCYAETLHRRLTGFGHAKYAEPFNVVRPWPPHLEQPLRVSEPTVWFVNSMSDLFHAALPFEYLRAVFDVMERAHWHTFQVLTKRSERLPSLASRLPWPTNVWMGVSIESQDCAYRADHLRAMPAAVRFISAEPLLSGLSLDLTGIHWLIAGGESGPGCRPMDLDWARSLRDQCEGAETAFFLKQLGGHPNKRGEEKALLDGRLWVDMPPSAMPSGVLKRNARLAEPTLPLLVPSA